LSSSIPSYDAIIIGAGHNGLTCACYLAKARLKVLVIEQYHSIGGMTITEEVTLPGFNSDVHAFGYQLANLSPVPVELNLSKYEFELIRPEMSYSHVFPDGGYISMYRNIEQTIKSIEKYSKKDSQTWKKMFERYIEDMDSIITTINSPPLPLYSQLAAIEKNSTIDSGFSYRSKLQSVRSWCNEWFESEEAKIMFGTFSSFVGLSPDDAGGGEIAYLFSSIIQHGGNNVVKGGFTNLCLALSKYLKSKGGEIITNTAVTKIIIKKGIGAVGVKLDNGKEIGVKKIVASSIDPSTLILKLIGEEHFNTKIVKGIKNMEWGDSVLAVYLALDAPVEYFAGPEIVPSAQLHLSPQTMDYLAKIFYECRAGKLPSEPLVIMSNDSVADPSRVPIGKHLLKFLVLNVPYKLQTNGTDTSNIYQPIDWDHVGTKYGDHVVDMINDKYIRNLKQIILKRVIYSPIDFEKRPSTAVYGTLSCGALVPYQTSSMRPIPELGRYKTSIHNIYMCGAGSHPGPGVSMAPGRNAAQIILADLNVDFNKLTTTE
jgi:phytoene dehydrogenase-like protein